MPKYIVRLEAKQGPRYLEFSTIVDAPLTYVTKTAPRTRAPRNRKRWYRCTCGLWWGKNKHYRCYCGELPPAAKP